MQPKLYSVKDLAEILKLHPKTILRFIHEGKIQAKKIGRTWMVEESDLKSFAHAELKQPQLHHDAVSTGRSENTSDAEELKNRITISSVIEIRETGSEEASRISNSIMAMLNSLKQEESGTRFDFLYYPEIRQAKYILFGSPQCVIRVMQAVETIVEVK